MKSRPCFPDPCWPDDAATLVAAERTLMPDIAIEGSYDGRDLPDVDLERLAEDILFGLNDIVAKIAD